MANINSDIDKAKLCVIQNELKKLGLYGGFVDGLFGEGSFKAFEALLDKPVERTGSYIAKYIFTSLQKALTNSGYGTRGVEGIWGEGSKRAFENAIKDFKKKEPSEYLAFNTTLGPYTISQKSADFILQYEGFVSKPYVPGGDQTSGVSLGYAYDLGQQSKESARVLLSKYYTESQVNRLLATVGLKGNSAIRVVGSLSDITITKEKAKEMAMELKGKYCQLVVNVYPEAIKLKPDGAGAILSLVYNRGSSLANTDKRKEMREIQEDFSKGNIKNIPARLRSMKRLWPNQRGLINRREGEACLIEGELS